MGKQTESHRNYLPCKNAEFKGLDTPGIFDTMFYKGDICNVCDFLFAFWNKNHLFENGSVLKRKNLLSLSRSPFQKGGKHFDRVVSSDNLSIP